MAKAKLVKNKRKKRLSSRSKISKTQKLQLIDNLIEFCGDVKGDHERRFYKYLIPFTIGLFIALVLIGFQTNTETFRLWLGGSVVFALVFGFLIWWEVKSLSQNAFLLNKLYSMKQLIILNYKHEDDLLYDLCKEIPQV